MGISARGQRAVCFLRFTPGTFDGRVQPELAQKLAPMPEYGHFRQRKNVNPDHLRDVAIAIERGAEENADVFDSWTGSGMESLFEHIVATRGVDNLLHTLFGLARGLEGNLIVHDLEQLAGAARMAVYGVRSEWLPPVPTGSNGLPEQRFDPKSTPLRNQCGDIEHEYLRQRNGAHVALIPFLNDLTVPEKFEVLSHLTPNFSESSTFALLAYTAGAENLSLGRTLQTWKRFRGTTGNTPEFILDVVRGQVSLEYAMTVVEPVDSSSGIDDLW